MAGVLLGNRNSAAVAGLLGKKSPATDSFVVYDGTLYKKKPDLSVYGIRPINILYVSRFWENWNDNPKKDSLPDEKTVRSLAREAKKQGDLVALDIEHWPLRGNDRVVAASLEKYSTVLRWFRDEAPNLQIGYFGIMPIADYANSRKGADSRDYKMWQSENDRLRPLAEMVDVIFPYIYTYHRDQDSWEKFAIENIKEARRYGKPIYVFLWPQYSEQNKQLSHQFIPPDYWKRQLNIAKQYADGIVIWGGWSDVGPAQWDDRALWWMELRAFMKSLSGQ